MNIIFKRKSVRTYLDIDVDDMTIEQIIRAGMAAPSAKNQLPLNMPPSKSPLPSVNPPILFPPPLRRTR